MPRFQVYTCEYVEQGVRYTLTAPSAQEAVLYVLEGDIPQGVQWDVKIMGEDCKKMTLQCVEDEDGNDVTPNPVSSSRGSLALNRPIMEPPSRGAI